MSNGQLLVNIAASVVLPQVVALVTKRFAVSWYKGLTLLALSSLTGALSQLTIGPGFRWEPWIIGWAQTFGGAVLVHYGLTKNVISGTDGILAKLKPNWGLGLLPKPATTVPDVIADRVHEHQLPDSDTSRY